MALAKTQDSQSFDEVYDNIARLYGHAENLLKIVETSKVSNHEKFLEFMEPMVAQIEKSTNQVAEDFAAIVEKGELPNNAMKRRVNSSLRSILQTVEEYREIVKNLEVEDE